jgi:hypothetical protein
MNSSETGRHGAAMPCALFYCFPYSMYAKQALYVETNIHTILSVLFLTQQLQ